MISPWWLLPAFLGGAICGFLAYDFWGYPLVQRWQAEDEEKRQKERQSQLASQAPARIRKLWPDLSETEVKSLLSLAELSGREFEELIGQWLERRGFEVKLVGGTGDQGIDIVARNV